MLPRYWYSTTTLILMRVVVEYHYLGSMRVVVEYHYLGSMRVVAR
jgi:hypothetical protein